MYEIDGEHRQLTAETLMALIELAVICLQEPRVPPIEQMRAKRLLKGALDLHPEGFVESKTNRLTGNVDWEALLSIYIEISRNYVDHQQEISPLLRKHFDDWFGALDDFHKEILLDVLPL